MLFCALTFCFLSFTQSFSFRWVSLLKWKNENIILLSRLNFDGVNFPNAPKIICCSGENVGPCDPLLGMLTTWPPGLFRTCEINLSLYCVHSMLCFLFIWIRYVSNKQIKQEVSKSSRQEVLKSVYPLPPQTVGWVP